MPFHPPWRPLRAGDLVYGKPEYACGFVLTHRLVSKLVDDPWRIDDYSTDLKFLAQLDPDRPRPGWNKGLWQQHLTDANLFVCFLQREPKYRVAVNNQGEDSHSPASVLAKHKGGLAWASKKTDKQVHFLLDGLNMKDVVFKTKKQTYGFEPFVNSELRWVYRNRWDSDVRKHIQFRFMGIPFPPPWEHREWSDLWRQYHPKNDSKRSAKETSLLGRLMRHLREYNNPLFVAASASFKFDPMEYRGVIALLADHAEDRRIDGYRNAVGVDNVLHQTQIGLGDEPVRSLAADNQVDGIPRVFHPVANRALFDIGRAGSAKGSPLRTHLSGS